MLKFRMLAATVAGVLLSASVQAQKPSLEEVLAKAAEYHVSYAASVSGAVLDEHYTLIRLVAGAMQTPVRFESDFVVLNVNGRILGLRDPYKVDNTALRERAPRIMHLLSEPTLDSWRQAQTHAAEQHFRFLFDLILTLNDPTIALQFLAPGVQPKLTFTLEKHETLNGVPVARIGFKETGSRESRFMLGTRDNAAASGRFWIDVATGAVHKSELWANSPNEAVVIKVGYAKDPVLKLWLPARMTETYQWKELDDVASNRNVGAYGQRLSFQASASYSNPRHTPVNLSTMRR